MAFDPVTKLSDVLTGGYHLNSRLQALLGSPLDFRRQEEAKAFSQELSRVFMVSLSMLKQTDDSKRTLNDMAPVIRTGDSFGFCTLAKERVTISREGVTSHKNSTREQEFTRKEITSTPHSKDGYQWRKYGQKNIQNCSFARYYYKCNGDRRCPAKKKVQQQDGSSDDAPMFEVTYVNDHTCHHVDDGSSQKSLPQTTTTGQQRSGFEAAANRNSVALFDPLHRVGSAEENEAIVSCLATVISGTGPSSPGAEPVAPPVYLPQSIAGASMVADGAMAMLELDTGFSWDHPSSPLCPAEVIMGFRDDVHMVDAARFGDTVWPQYYT